MRAHNAKSSFLENDCFQIPIIYAYAYKQTSCDVCIRLTSLFHVTPIQAYRNAGNSNGPPEKTFHQIDLNYLSLLFTSPNPLIVFKPSYCITDVGRTINRSPYCASKTRLTIHSIVYELGWTISEIKGFTVLLYAPVGARRTCYDFVCCRSLVGRIYYKNEYIKRRTPSVLIRDDVDMKINCCRFLKSFVVWSQ